MSKSYVSLTYVSLTYVVVATFLSHVYIYFSFIMVKERKEIQKWCHQCRKYATLSLVKHVSFRAWMIKILTLSMLYLFVSSRNPCSATRLLKRTFAKPFGVFHSLLHSISCEYQILQALILCSRHFICFFLILSVNVYFLSIFFQLPCC